MVFGIGKSKGKGKRGETSGTNPPPPPPPVVFKGDEGLPSAAKTFFKKLEAKPLRVSKFLHAETLRDLQIYDQTRALLTKVGLENYLNLNLPTYPAYTLEFLSTLSLSGSKGSENERVNFRLHKVWHSISFDEVRNILRITLPPSPVNPPANALQEFWCGVTGRVTLDHNDKVTHITNPAIRLIGRMIMCLFFSMGEPTKINDSVRECLWAMLPEGEGVPDWARLFVVHGQKHKEKKGAINCGGLVTLFVQHFVGQIPEEQPQTWGNNLYNEAGLFETHMIRVLDTDPWSCSWLGEGLTEYMRLPLGHPLPSGFRARDFFCPPQGDLPRVPAQPVRKRRAVEQSQSSRQVETREGGSFEGGIHDTPMQDVNEGVPQSFTPFEQQVLSYFDSTKTTLEALSGRVESTQQWHEENWTNFDVWRTTLEDRSRLHDEAEKAQKKMMEEMLRRQDEDRVWREQEAKYRQDELRRWEEQEAWRASMTQQFEEQNTRHEEYLNDSYEDSRLQEDSLGIIRGLFGMTLNPSNPPMVDQAFVDETYTRAQNVRRRREERRKNRGTYEKGGSSGAHE